MKVSIALFVMALIVMPSVQAAPINNSTTEAPVVQQVTEVVQPTITSEVPTPDPVPVVETEQVVKHPVGCENYHELVSQYEWNVDVALEVMSAETGCNPSAIGDNRVIGGIYAPSCGLFQIRTLSGRPTCEQLQDPTTNIEWAIKLYRASGWKPWSVCRTKVNCY